MAYSDSAINFNSEFSSAPAPKRSNADLEEFLLVEREKAKMTETMFEFTDICWDKCMTDKPGQRLESKTESCIENCVNRFIDVSLFITNRLSQKRS